VGVKGNLPDKARLLEVELELLCWMQIVQDYESARGLVAGDFSEADALGRESSHRSIIVEVGAAKR